GLGEFAQPRNRQRTLEQGIGRVHVQMDEAGHSSSRFSTRCECAGTGGCCPPRPRSERERCGLSPARSGRGGGVAPSSAPAIAALHSVAMTCAQIAIMPKNSASDASVAASSTRARTMISYSHSTGTRHEHSSCYVPGQVPAGWYAERTQTHDRYVPNPKPLSQF